MDNTTNGQNPPSPSIPQPAASPLPGQAFPVNQYPNQQQPIQNQPVQPVPPIPPQPDSSQQVVQQPPVQPVPQQAVDMTSQPPLVPENTGPKITLDDLYGPSGFADDTSSPQVSQPLQPPVASTTSPVVAQAPVSPVQAPVTPQIPPSPVVPQQDTPQGAAIPNLPTTDTNPVQPVVVPEVPVSSEPVSQESKPSITQEDNPSQELPLRKPSFETQPIPVTPAPQAASNQAPPPSSPKAPEKEKTGGLNKVFLLRMLFGGIAVVVFLVIILFVVQALSSIFHPTASGKVTLTYWGLWEDSTTMQSVISQFESQHPNISVNYIKEDPKQYSQQLITRIQQGNGPDIFTYHSSWLPMLQNDLVPLPTTVMSKSDLEQTYYPVIKNDLVANGAVYGLPLEVDTLALFVNNKLLQDAKAQVPTSWDAFASTARALTVKDASGKITTAGAAMGTYDNITHAPDILSALLMQNGVDITKMQPASNASDALTFYTSFAMGDSKVWDNTLDPSQLAFVRGNLAMYFGYSWDVFAIKAANPNLDFSIYPIPHLPGRNTTAASYWVQGVSVKSPHQQEAMAFLQFLGQKNTVATLFSEEAKTRLFGEPYARLDLGETLKDNPLVYPFAHQALDARSSFFAGETYDTGLNGPMNGYLGNAVRSVLGNTSASSAIETLTQGVTQVEQQYATN